MIYLSKMAMFFGYVKLPEDIVDILIYFAQLI